MLDSNQHRRFWRPPCYQLHQCHMRKALPIGQAAYRQGQPTNRRFRKRPPLSSPGKPTPAVGTCLGGSTTSPPSKPRESNPTVKRLRQQDCKASTTRPRQPKSSDDDYTQQNGCNNGCTTEGHRHTTVQQRQNRTIPTIPRHCDGYSKFTSGSIRSQH